MEVDVSNPSKDSNWCPIHSRFFKSRPWTAKCMFTNAIQMFGNCVNLPVYCLITKQESISFKKICSRLC